MAEGSALINPSEPLNIARHEIMVTLDEVMEAAAGLLVPGGSFILYTGLQDLQRFLRQWAGTGWSLKE